MQYLGFVLAVTALYVGGIGAQTQCDGRDGATP